MNRDNNAHFKDIGEERRREKRDEKIRVDNRREMRREKRVDNRREMRREKREKRRVEQTTGETRDTRHDKR
jgi:hypothetical protein